MAIIYQEGKITNIKRICNIKISKNFKTCKENVNLYKDFKGVAFSICKFK